MLLTENCRRASARSAHDLVTAGQSRVPQRRPHLRVETLDHIRERDDGECSDTLELVLDEVLRDPGEERILAASLQDHPTAVGIAEGSGRIPLPSSARPTMRT